MKDEYAIASSLSNRSKNICEKHQKLWMKYFEENIPKNLCFNCKGLGFVNFKNPIPCETCGCYGFVKEKSKHFGKNSSTIQEEKFGKNC